MFGVHAYVPQFRSTSNIILIKVNVIVTTKSCQGAIYHVV
jgi:hypothetical protein